VGRPIDCAQIVLTCGAATNWESAALQPGQPLPGILKLEQAGIGALTSCRRGRGAGPDSMDLFRFDRRDAALSPPLPGAGCVRRNAPDLGGIILDFLYRHPDHVFRGHRQYRLMPIELVIKRGLVYSLLTVSTVGGYLIFIELAQKLLAQGPGRPVSS